MLFCIFDWGISDRLIFSDNCQFQRSCSHRCLSWMIAKHLRANPFCIFCIKLLYMRLKHTLLQYFLEETPVLFWLLQKSDYSSQYYWDINYYVSNYLKEAWLQRISFLQTSNKRLFWSDIVVMSMMSSA